MNAAYNSLLSDLLSDLLSNQLRGQHRFMNFGIILRDLKDSRINVFFMYLEQTNGTKPEGLVSRQSWRARVDTKHVFDMVHAFEVRMAIYKDSGKTELIYFLYF